MSSQVKTVSMIVHKESGQAIQSENVPLVGVQIIRQPVETAFHRGDYWDQKEWAQEWMQPCPDEFREGYEVREYRVVTTLMDMSSADEEE